MSITVPRKAFLEALKLVAPAVKAPSHFRWTGTVRLTGSGNLLVQGFNGDVGVTAEAESAAMFGTIVVPFDPLLRFVNNAADQIELDPGDDLIVESGSASLKLRTMPADDLPRLADATGTPLLLDADILKQIGGALYAASQDPARPILTGLGLVDGWAVCTDSYRLSAVKLDAGLPDAIIPADTVRQVAKYGADETSISVDDTRATFRADGATWTCRLIQGQFPNWQRLVGTPTGRLGGDRQQLLEALDQVDIFGSEWVRVEPLPTGIGLGTRGPDGDTASVVVDGIVSDTISFTTRYLVDLLKALPDDTVDIGVDGATKPALVGSLEGGRIDLLMPVRQN